MYPFETVFTQYYFLAVYPKCWVHLINGSLRFTANYYTMVQIQHNLFIH